MVRVRSVTMMSLALLVLSASGGVQAAEPPPARPNFVVILVDDMGMSDLGAFGGEARTPTIDALAGAGAMFTGYHTSPLCSPSRAMLLTGVSNHRAGVGTIPEVLTASQSGRPEYQMFLRGDVPTMATRLRDAGYRTYMTGKWHLGHEKGQLPVDHGFDRSFILDASGADNYEQKPYMPYYARADWFEDDRRATLPKDFYSSRFLVDQMMKYLDGDKNPQNPFLAYIAFQALHIPLQAPRELTAQYLDTYAVGFQAIREQRWARAKALGLVPLTAEMPPLHPALKNWDSLSADERALFAKRMAVHAAMLEAMDQNIGRLVAHLRDKGQLQNTVFVITSDNGPEPNDPLAVPGFGVWMAFNGYHHRLEDLGERGSTGFIGPEWASVTATPGRLFKFHASEGGTHVPLIISGAGVPPQRIGSLSQVADIAPTLYDYAGLDPKTLTPALEGRSLKPVLTGAAPHTYGPNDPVALEVSANSFLIKGDYKLTRDTPKWGDGRWRLHHLASDPGEARDLREAEPERFNELLRDYEAYAERVGVVKLPEEFNPYRQVTRNALIRQVQHYGPAWAGAALLILALWAWRRRRKAR